MAEQWVAWAKAWTQGGTGIIARREDIVRGKEAAARHAAGLVEPGMTVGLGSGSTAEIVVEVLGKRLQSGLRFRGVPTSEATARLARALHIPLINLDEAGRLDMTIDGADEVDPQLNLIKGHGGALLREKLVAEATEIYVIAVDPTKLVSRLGEHTAVPVEVVPFGWSLTADRLRSIDLMCELRGGDRPYVTDGHNYILDCRLPANRDESFEMLARAIKLQTGVVEHGLFLGKTSQAIVGYGDGTVSVLAPN